LPFRAAGKRIILANLKVPEAVSDGTEPKGPDGADQ